MGKDFPLLPSFIFEHQRNPVDQTQDFFVFNPIEHPQAFFSGVEDPGLLKDGQVFGDIGLFLVDGREDFTDERCRFFNKSRICNRVGCPRALRKTAWIFRYFLLVFP